jgi:lantibiotic modifying enzyme
VECLWYSKPGRYAIHREPDLHQRVCRRAAVRDEASRRMGALITAAEAYGDYHWDIGDKRFNLGLFQGMAGVGYVMLRLIDPTLPNVLIWQ